MSLALVVLAAGASTRLGACKALVDLGGASPLVRLLTALTALAERAPTGKASDSVTRDAWTIGDGNFRDRPLVIAGAHFLEIARAAPANVDVLENPDWAAGRLGGIALAARARPDRDLLLAPVDVPLVPAAVFAALREAWEAAGRQADGWLAPFVVLGDGRRAYGHPVVVGRRLAARAGSLGKEVPLRALRELADPLLSIAVDTAAILDDLDTPADLERLRRRIS